jgi:hypothetical protein
MVVKFTPKGKRILINAARARAKTLREEAEKIEQQVTKVLSIENTSSDGDFNRLRLMLAAYWTTLEDKT